MDYGSVRERDGVRRDESALNDYVAGNGPALFAQACAIGLEGIVSKRRSSPYRSGRSPHWLKAKNPVRGMRLGSWSRCRADMMARGERDDDVELLTYPQLRMAALATAPDAMIIAITRDGGMPDDPMHAIAAAIAELQAIPTCRGRLAR